MPKMFVKFLFYVSLKATISQPILKRMTAALSDEVKAEWAKQIPLRRGGTPEDVANVATFLASDLSSYVTGQVIHCCGGMNM